MHRIAAEGLRQALAATDVYYGSDLTTLDLASTIKSLEAGSDVPSALIRLSRAEFIDQPIDKLLISSGLLASKSPPASPRESLLAMLIVLSSQLKHGKRSRLVRSRSTASGSRREAFSERSPRRTSLTACSSSCDPGSRRTRLSCWNEHLVGGNLSSPLHVPHPTADASLRMSCVTPRVRSQGHYWGAEPLCAQRLSLLIEGVEPI